MWPILTIAHVDDRELTEEEEVDLRCKTGRPRLLPLVQLRVVDEEMRDIVNDGAGVGKINKKLLREKFTAH